MKTVLCLFLFSALFGEVIEGPKDYSLKFFDDLEVNGATKLRLVKAKSLTIHGPLEFHSLDVSGPAQINDSITGEKGKFGSLTVQGAVDVNHVMTENLSVKGPVRASYLMITNTAEIDGHANLDHGQFKTLKLKGDDIVLDEVTAETIIIQKGNTIVIKGASNISGDITFESGNGIVKLQAPATIKNVKGGKVKN